MYIVQKRTEPQSAQVLQQGSASTRTEQDCGVPELENPIQKVWMHFQETTTALTALTKGKLINQGQIM